MTFLRVERHIGYCPYSLFDFVIAYSRTIIDCPISIIVQGIAVVIYHIVAFLV